MKNTAFYSDKELLDKISELVDKVVNGTVNTSGGGPVSAGTGTVTNVPTSTVEAQALAANTNRLGYKISNNANETLFILESATGVCSVTNHSYTIAPKSGNTEGVGYSFVPYSGRITMVLASGTGTALVTEFTA